MGPPDHRAVDKGSSYVSKEMCSNLVASEVRIEEVSIDTPGYMDKMERYHAPLRFAL